MSEFAEFVREHFAGLGPIRTRKMFGGYGVYFEDAMFALIADDTLYFKVDQGNIALFKAKNLPAFQFNKNGKWVTMSYYQAPNEALDDIEQAHLWAMGAIDAALRAKKRCP